MKAVITWKGGLRFTGRSEAGLETVMDAPEAVGGSGSAPRPMELLLMALGGCTGMDVVSILAKKRKTVTSLEISVEAVQRDDYPKRLLTAVITYRIAGPDLDEESVGRAVELSEGKYCSVGATLREPVEISSRVEVTRTGGPRRPR